MPIPPLAQALSTLQSSLRVTLELTRWLGPWSAEATAPRRVRRSHRQLPPEQVGERPVDVWLYEPDRPPLGTWVVSMGLHFEGPTEARMDRFSRVLAGAGFRVYAPFLPDYRRMRLSPTLITDFERAFRAILDDPDRPRDTRPALFSISFGSLPALRLASNPELAQEVGALMTFGGYADWQESVRFIVTGEAQGTRSPHHDPLNRPAVFLHYAEALAQTPAQAAALRAAWLLFLERTWGREDMKREGAYQAVAHQIAPNLPADARPLFLLGCGADEAEAESALEHIEAAMAHQEDDFLDPRPWLHELRCEVHIVHGVDDDVVPYTQLETLQRALPPHITCETYLTGLYGRSLRV